MSYIKPAQTQYAANLKDGEFVVKIDTTPVAPVAVRTVGSVCKDTGNVVINAYARVVKNDGSDYLDTNGAKITTTFQTSMDRKGVADLGGGNVLKKLMLLTVLGEDVVNGTPKWINAPDSTALEHANIRVNIASAVDAAATDPSVLL